MTGPASPGHECSVRILSFKGAIAYVMMVIMMEIGHDRAEVCGLRCEAFGTWCRLRKLRKWCRISRNHDVIGGAVQDDTTRTFPISSGENDMSIEGRIESLEREHANMKRRVLEANSCPGMDGLMVQDLKKQKLRIKETLERTRKQAS